jgi:predicted transcriptional regulator
MGRELKRNRITAFRLPAPLLSEVDDFCDRYDCTRSQFFRRSIVEFIERHGVEVEAVNAGNGSS